jgi:diphthamide biosynthesis protein 2
MSVTNHRVTNAPVLSTPESHIFEDPTPAADASELEILSDDELYVRYEIPRTLREIREAKWRRVALQFEDSMLGHAVRVYEALREGLASDTLPENSVLDRTREGDKIQQLGHEIEGTTLNEDGRSRNEDEVKLFILADTSYGACCVDEIAAEHVSAEGVVHYGRACLSPTARLPVIYVFTTKPLDLISAVGAFKTTYPDLQQKIVLMVDVPYSAHMDLIASALQVEGYVNIFATKVIHDPSSALPNRTVPSQVSEKLAALKDYALFHIGQPPAALLLILSSRVESIHIYLPENNNPTAEPKALLSSTARPLRRRYALVTSLSTASIFGILVNTLSVKNYQGAVAHVQKQIAAAGKKSYTFVVGKVNAAKIANFAEIGGWVVIGCWESSLVESADFYRPLITPWELELALKPDSERVWTGQWIGDFETVLKASELNEKKQEAVPARSDDLERDDRVEGDLDFEEESAPPEFDLRTGRLVSHSRPMRAANGSRGTRTGGDGVASGNEEQKASGSSALIKKANGDLAQIGGVASPGAEFLRSARTWQGLGTDFEVDYTQSGGQGTVVEEGRSGVARGYTAGSDESRR